ncbi:MAG: Fe-only nitrogenase accessory AnfO family protein [Carboxydocellales bacterium]|jgi:Fe-only nitrogenase accessory protein AnfO
MQKEIGIYMNVQGETASLNEPGRIVVFQKKQGQWSITREQPFNPGKSVGLAGLRRKMEELISFLADCRIFVGFSIVGITYFSLEKAGFSIWEFHGKPEEFLDYIQEQEALTENDVKKCDNQKNDQIIPLPVETSAGCYQISLKKIQENNLGLTSKQVLLPFLRQGKFFALEVICSHLPPWLEAELLQGNLTGAVEKIGPNELKVTISNKSISDASLGYKKCCQEC